MHLTLLRDLYNENPVARAFLDHAASRAYNQRETKTDRALAILRPTIPDISRGDIVRLFRELETAGCGRYIVGRHQHPSRFAWDYPMRDIGQIASGDREPDEDDETACFATSTAPDIDTTDATARATDEDDPEDLLRSHAFPLRSDLELTLSLPRDLTRDEAVRLAFFVRSLAVSE